MQNISYCLKYFPCFRKASALLLIYLEAGGEVSFNSDAKRVIYNDKCKQLVNIFNNLDSDFLNEVEKKIEEWNLSKSNKEEFLALRKYYNENLDVLSDREKSIILYCLLTHSFNNQIAFNPKGEFNTPSGVGRSYFTSQLKEKLKKYIEIKNKTDILFLSEDVTDIDATSFGSASEAFVYADPPYLITVGAYERDYFCKWSEEYERKLYQYLDELSMKGYKFALSNVLEHKGKSNDILKKWAIRYNVHFLNYDYKNCNYQTKDKSVNSSVEVLITNY